VDRISLPMPERTKKDIDNINSIINMFIIFILLVILVSHVCLLFQIHQGNDKIAALASQNEKLNSRIDKLDRDAYNSKIEMDNAWKNVGQSVQESNNKIEFLEQEIIYKGNAQISKLFLVVDKRALPLVPSIYYYTLKYFNIDNGKLMVTCPKNCISNIEIIFNPKDEICENKQAILAARKIKSIVSQKKMKFEDEYNYFDGIVTCIIPDNNFSEHGYYRVKITFVHDNRSRTLTYYFLISK